MKKSFLIRIGWVCCCAVFIWAWPGMSFASTFGIVDIDNLAFLYESGSDSRPDTASVLESQVYRYDLAEGNPLAGLSGTYEIMYLGYEAGNTDTLDDGSGIIFTNKTSTVLGTKSVDMGTAVFNDLGGPGIPGPYDVYLTGTDYSYLDIYKVAGSFLKQWTKNDWFDAAGEYYVVGFEDGHPDDDFDDLVVAFKVAAVPIPSSVLLLGSGVLGLMGFGLRRRGNLNVWNLRNR